MRESKRCWTDTSDVLTRWWLSRKVRIRVLLQKSCTKTQAVQQSAALGSQIGENTLSWAIIWNLNSIILLFEMCRSVIMFVRTSAQSVGVFALKLVRVFRSHVPEPLRYLQPHRVRALPIGGTSAESLGTI